MNTTAQTVKPWYREPWPWILMAGPAIVVVAGFITAWLAIRSNDGLVEDDYYKKGLAVHQRIARDEAAGSMHLRAELMQGADREVRLFLNAQEGAALPEVLVMRIIHPTRAGHDQTIELKRDAGSYYTGKLGAPLSGRWHIQLEDQQRSWRLAGDWNVDQDPALRLLAATPATPPSKSSN